MTQGLLTVLDPLSHWSDNRGSFGRLPGTWPELILGERALLFPSQNT